MVYFKPITYYVYFYIYDNDVSLTINLLEKPVRIKKKQNILSGKLLPGYNSHNL